MTAVRPALAPPSAAPRARRGRAPAPVPYLNRELSWLDFNARVLHEASDERNPLLERVKFLAIVNANLDEFFMKRIGGLKQQVGAGVHDLTVDGRTPEEFKRFVERSIASFRKLVQLAGIEPQ